MTTYESTRTIEEPAKKLPAYLSDVDNLPESFPKTTSAQDGVDETVQGIKKAAEKAHA